MCRLDDTLFKQDIGKVLLGVQALAHLFAHLWDRISLIEVDLLGILATCPLSVQPCDNLINIRQVSWDCLGQIPQVYCILDRLHAEYLLFLSCQFFLTLLNRLFIVKSRIIVDSADFSATRLKKTSICMVNHLLQMRILLAHYISWMSLVADKFFRMHQNILLNLLFGVIFVFEELISVAHLQACLLVQVMHQA